MHTARTRRPTAPCTSCDPPAATPGCGSTASSARRTSGRSTAAGAGPSAQQMSFHPSAHRSGARLLGTVLPLLGLAFASPAPQGDPELRLGEAMYREGVLPSGKPMRALVKGDVPTEGTMFSCATCHLRSGVGSVEGAV